MRRRPATIKDRTITEQEIREYIGGKIREMRKKLGISASTIAQKLDVSREAVTHIETGRNNISGVSLWKLAVLFKCDMADFFPAIPDGFALTKVDIHKIAQENPGAAKWAEKLFGKKQQ